MVTQRTQIRLNQIDHYLAPPGPLDACASFDPALPHVPILRIYGQTSLGARACLHVHQVFPYVYVDYDGKGGVDPDSRYILKLTHSLNHALALSLRLPPSSSSQFIRSIVLVKAVDFYGFHFSHSPFLKILVNDPKLVYRLVGILQGGGVMQRRFKVYESHLSFYLQFMCDFNLVGCGWVELGEEVWIRGDGSSSDREHPGSNHSAGNGTFLNSAYPRHSKMDLELDVVSHQILNRHKISARNIHHELRIPSSSAFGAGDMDEVIEPLVHSVRELWEDEKKRRVAAGLNPSPEMPKVLSAGSRGKGGQWVAEERLWDALRKKIEKDAEKASKGNGLQDGNGKEWEKWVMTTFESVEALWDDRWKTWVPGNHGEDETEQSFYFSQIPHDGDEAEVDVDDKLVSSQELYWNIVDGPEDGEDFEGIDGAEEEDEEDANQGGMQSKLSTPKKRKNVWDDFNKTPTRSPRTMRRSPSKTPSKRFFERAPQEEITPRPMKRLRSDSTPAAVSPLRFPTPGDTPDQLEDLEDDEDEDEDVMPIEGSLSFLTIHPRPSGPHPSATPGTGTRLYRYFPRAPTPSSLPPLSSYNLPNKLYRDPYYSQIEDVPTRKRVYAGMVYDLKGGNRESEYGQELDENRKGTRPRGGGWEEWRGTKWLDPWDETCRSLGPKVDALVIGSRGKEKEGQIRRLWSYAHPPPSVGSTRSWLKAEKRSKADAKGTKLKTRAQRGPRAEDVSQLSGPTQLLNSSIVDPRAAAQSIREEHGMTILSLEVAALSKGTLRPDPESDSLTAVFISFQDLNFSTNGDNENADETEKLSRAHQYTNEIYVLESESLSPRRLREFKPATSHVSLSLPSVPGSSVPLQTSAGRRLPRSPKPSMYALATELELIERIIDRINELDPDILVGWEIMGSSWGWLCARAGVYGLDVSGLISRAPVNPHPSSSSFPRSNRGDVTTSNWDAQHGSPFKVNGRHALNVWRVMRASLTLRTYSFEEVVMSLLKQRVPKYSSQTLSEWLTSPTPSDTSKALKYMVKRTYLVLEMLDQAQIITQTAEFARVFGIDFYSVLSRGSQFKVESFMFRIAKPESFILISPSKKDVGKQNAAECIPLIMEPLSAFYPSPLVVLDFQSLYPSVMIAYNFCYSTCLGRVQDFQGKNKLGVVDDLKLPDGLWDTLKDWVFVAPNGIVYLKPAIRKGLLGRMLTEILDTRVMVKQAMKLAKGDKTLLRVLEARQLSLKFIANVTYGYTSASFSGRMPAVEIADSIVQTGRETLEKAITFIDNTPEWGAKVVYGDTDSLFVYLKGKTKEEAFKLGYEMVDKITAMNPAPIKLKFEKVYLPCVLMAKKRYVGFKYENLDDKEPVFDAKGIETVRRDGVPAQSKMTERSLKILFRTQDLSEVKSYCYKSWHQIMEGKVSIMDFIFAKEVRMGTYSDRVPPPPGVMVAARRQLEDGNDEAQYGERVPYLIARGEPGSRLVERAVSPEEFMNDRHKHLDTKYYISQNLIPPLERIFNLVGADVRGWYDTMPKTVRAYQGPIEQPLGGEKVTRVHMDDHFHRDQTSTSTRKSESLTNVNHRMHRATQKLLQTHHICRNCSGSAQLDVIKCESLACPWFYERKKAEDSYVVAISMLPQPNQKNQNRK